MSRRSIVILFFTVLHGLACLALTFPYDRDIAAVLLVVLFTVSCGLSVTLFVIWRRPFHHGLFFLLWAVGLLVVFFVGWGENWFTALPDEEPLASLGGTVPEQWFSDVAETGVIPPYGEAFAREGGIYQPLSTLTDLAFISAGFAIVLLASLSASGAGRSENRDSAVLPLGKNAAVRWDRPFLWLLGLVVIFMGPASMYLHASFRNWAGWTDSFSVYNLGLFGLSYCVYRLMRSQMSAELVPWIVSLGLYLILAIACGLIGMVGEARLFLIAFGLAIWLVAELALAIGFAVGYSGRGYSIAWWWGLVFLGLFAASGVFKFLIEESAKFATAWQPHAVFHTLAATALPFAYLYWSSERPARR